LVSQLFDPFAYFKDSENINRTWSKGKMFVSHFSETLAQLRGRVVEHRPDPDLKSTDLVSRKYTGKPFPMRSPEGRVALIIEIDKARHLKIPFKHEPPK